VRLHLSAIFLFALLSAACAAPQAGPPLDSVPALRESASDWARQAGIEVRESVSYETYAVDGSSPGEVRAALDRLGPFAEDGRQYDDLTSWSLTWSFSFNQRKDSCSLASATIEVRSVVTLPELVSESLDARARRRWDSYLAALARNASSNSAASLQRPGASDHGLIGKCLAVQKWYDSRPKEGGCSRASVRSAFIVA
jgi:hypothetical protein